MSGAVDNGTTRNILAAQYSNEIFFQKQAEYTNAQLLDGLEKLQREVLVYLDALAAEGSAAVLSRRGRHAVFGETTVEYILRRIYRHEREHMAELRQALQDR